MPNGRHAPLLVRFREKFVQGEPDECWIWHGAKYPAGYGMILNGGRLHLAHRVAYELHHGITLPPRRSLMVIMHTCDNPGCVNPAHLRLDTQRANLADAYAKGRKRDSMPPRNVGSKHGMAKLTEELVATIRREFSAGKRIVHIAAETGVHPTTLADVRDRKTWKHIP